MLRLHGHRNYTFGKWHVTALTESGATGSLDGWPPGRGFDGCYDFMVAETDQYGSGLVHDDGEHVVTAPDRPGTNEFTLLIDGKAAGRIQSRPGFANFISWSSLDIGDDQVSPVSHRDAPFEFIGRLIRVTVTMDDDRTLDGVGLAQLALE
jgi:hypothetical protein